ncbi:hypothetical protein DH2020_027758 [Rehmannia glutinosa]|uniref:Chalcone-flavonone isomerase family protein n=1 Tax=Rehmannia glutinosa TaxID=99300 RepID=A0ABR0VTB0_REHGL
MSCHCRCLHGGGISFSKDDSIPEQGNAVIVNKQLSEAVLESIIGKHGVSPLAKQSLALRLTELLKQYESIGVAPVGSIGFKGNSIYNARLIICRLLVVAGAPYDTLEEVIAISDSDNVGSLRDFGIDYREVPLADDGGLDWDALRVAWKPQKKCVLIQRSYRIEPPMGADLIAGSFIRNPGGTIAPCDGYVAGSKKWVAAAAALLSAPGLGVDCGSTPGDIMRIFFQGLFLAPQMFGEAIKESLLIAEVMAGRGYKVQPVQLGSCERLLAFCEVVQRSPPVSSFTKPIAGATPGYASEGGSHWTQWELVLEEILISNDSKSNANYTLLPNGDDIGTSALGPSEDRAFLCPVLVKERTLASCDMTLGKLHRRIDVFDSDNDSDKCTDKTCIWHVNEDGFFLTLNGFLFFDRILYLLSPRSKGQAQHHLKIKARPKVLGPGPG